MSDTEGDTTMIDEDAVREEKMMYGHGAMTEQDLDEKYPNRPHNHSRTLPFSDLFLTLFNPLQENKKKPIGAINARRRQGPQVKSPNDIRRGIIERFISRWRKVVGNDIFPAFRLIVPEKDRDRAMYGLKEMTIGKLLVKIMKIDKNSEDGYSILHWKLPGFKSSSAMAGDFAGRCFEVISKRPMRTTPGDMTIAEVNELLDRLSVAQKEENQRPIIEEFYNRMNAEELMWLIRMILRQMKIGATEKTILELWHPDAENLFNISSNLRRVCWELYDAEVRLEGDKRGIHIMECFQPQLAAFQMRSMEQMVKKMRPEGDDEVFWIEEKLDGERMQLHMIHDDDTAGGFRFKFWSRKAKDYTYLYGESFEDSSGSLTKHMKGAFQTGVQSIILDGEMITWNMETDKISPFGTLKTAAISEQNTQVSFDGGSRPVYRIFDCIYLNGKDLTNHTLRVRRAALEKAVQPVHRRFEIHAYDEARDAAQIEPKLREVVADKSEGLVLKNPRSAYRLNDRNDDWIKVKPEYMTEFGEALDCVVIGGYFGSGKRGGALSSFLCGLRIDQAQIDQGNNPQKCFSFFKVGGGFNAADYAEVRHRTDGKWIEWDYRSPPTDWIVLGGAKLQYERPDVWIKPEDSIVLEVKAASVHTTDQFGYGKTLRFPRLKRIRTDKTWEQALSALEFGAVRERVEEERKEKQFKIEDARKNRSVARKRKRGLVIQGQEEKGQKLSAAFAGPPKKVFDNMAFCVMTEAVKPLKKSKAEIESFIKVNGGTVVASETGEDTICIADRNLVKVASVQKRAQKSIIRPQWLYDQVAQSEKDEARLGGLGEDEIPPLPVELDRHAYFAKDEDAERWATHVDGHGDSYFRDLETHELASLFAKMDADSASSVGVRKVLDEMIGLGQEKLGRGFIFYGLKAYFEDLDEAARRTFVFAGGELTDDFEDPKVTHVFVAKENQGIDRLKRSCASRPKMPHLVMLGWIADCWKEGDRCDEQAFAA